MKTNAISERVDSLSFWSTSSCSATKASLFAISMLNAGLTYDSPLTVADGLSVSLLTEEEVATATANVACTAETGWLDVFYAVLSDYQQQAIDREGAVLSAQLEAQSDRMTALGLR